MNDLEKIIGYYMDRGYSYNAAKRKAEDEIKNPKEILNVNS